MGPSARRHSVFCVNDHREGIFISEQQLVSERQISRGLADNNTQLDPLELVVAAFGEADGWRVDRHPRLVADTTGDGRADIVGFGYDGVWVSRAKPVQSFTAPELVVANFGYDAGWRVELHPRLVADITNDGRVVGFRGDGVSVPHAQQR